MKCADCKWWIRTVWQTNELAEYGTCKRFPPSIPFPLRLNRGDYVKEHAAQPLTHGEEIWCGEFSLKKETTGK